MVRRLPHTMVLLSLRLTSAACRYDKPFRSSGELMVQACQYSAIVFSTWPEQHTLIMSALLNQRCPGQKFVLVTHNPDNLLDPMMGAALHT